MSIKDKIEKLPDDAIISHIEYDHYAGGGYIDCSHADLKALSASHTALLDESRRVLLSLENFKDDAATDPRVEERYENLKAAIEEAEKL